MENRIVQRRVKNIVSSASVSIIAVLAAFVIGGFIISFMGTNPITAYGYMLKGSLGSANAIGETVVKATPLILTGLSFAVAHRCGLVNIGAEGQLYIGALFATMAGTQLEGLPIILHLPISVLAGFVGGALWGVIAAVLKTHFGASEIIVTIMLNYVAQYFVSFMVSGPIIDPSGTNPQSPLICASARLFRIIPGTRINLGIIIALLSIFLYYFIIWRTTFGYSMRVVGINQEAARYAGMKPKQSIMTALFLAGGFAGLAGACEILGVQGRLFQSFSSGYGFDGIAVALLGNNSPLGILPAALLFGLMSSGSNMMQMFSKVPAAVVGVIQSIVILFVVGRTFIQKLNSKRILKKAVREVTKHVGDNC